LQGVFYFNAPAFDYFSVTVLAPLMQTDYPVAESTQEIPHSFAVLLTIYAMTTQWAANCSAFAGAKRLTDFIFIAIRASNSHIIPHFV